MHIHDRNVPSLKQDMPEFPVPPSGSSMNFVFFLSTLFLFLGHFRFAFGCSDFHILHQYALSGSRHHKAGNAVGSRSVEGSDTGAAL